MSNMKSTLLTNSHAVAGLPSKAGRSRAKSEKLSCVGRQLLKMGRFWRKRDTDEIFENCNMKLETERLILRDFVKDDWQSVLDYQIDPLYLRYNYWTERTPEDAQEFVGWFLSQQN